MRGEVDFMLYSRPRVPCAAWVSPLPAATWSGHLNQRLNHS
jgi:hypothetical protein